MNQGAERDRNLGPRQGPTLLRNSDPNLQVSRALGLVGTCAKEMSDTCPLRKTRQNHQEDPSTEHTRLERTRPDGSKQRGERPELWNPSEDRQEERSDHWRGSGEAERNQFQARVAGT